MAASRAMQFIAVTLACMSIVTSVFSQTALKTVTWDPGGSPYSMSSYDCTKTGVGTIFISGKIQLEHPSDDMKSSAPEIYLKCDNFIFMKDSKVIVAAALYIRGDVSISGNVDIENVRGIPGNAGSADPAIYIRRKEANGDAGARGGDGDGAVDTSFKYPNGKNADNGGPGKAGSRGIDGRPTPQTSDGRIGAAAATITLKTRNYGPATTIVMTSKGGRGGNGADGGTGYDGGDGGPGGIGGRGGDAAFGRTAGDGGAGGGGGDGGDGARGGPGGNGGDGGRGGDGRVYLISDSAGKHGNPPAEWTYYLDGGGGGDPGIGGAPGRFGIGVAGAFGGCGGTGARTGPVVWHPDGNCGSQGPHGRDGVDGQPGTIGAYGKDGKPGEPGNWQIGIVIESGGH